MTAERHDLEHEQTRSFLLHLPREFETSRSWPLVIGLHGGGGTADKFLRSSRMPEVADRNGFVLVAPDAVDWRWDDGRTRDPEDPEVDDVGFVAALIDHLCTNWPVDPARVYVAGISRGGYMAMRLACEMPERLAAIGVVAAAMLEDVADDACPARAVPVALMKGMADEAAPWEGGRDVSLRGFVLSADETVEFWAAVHDVEDTDPAVVLLPPVEGDPTRVRRSAWVDAEGSERVVLYAIENGGHNWPGGVFIDETAADKPVARSMLRRMYGKCTTVIDGGEELWRFFSAHRLPGRG